MTRRRVLTWIGAAGLVAAVPACRDTDDEATSPSTSHPSSTALSLFGGVIDLGPEEDVRGAIARDGVMYVPEGRLYLVDDPADGSLLALYQKCTHLGCRVPFCTSSGWFECPCHASLFDRTGVHAGGPAPRGLDRFEVTVRDRSVSIDTRTVIPGEAVSAGRSPAPPSGPHCIAV